ncbi:DUF7619 domain-containing protein [Flavobacterium pallidum]|uniref:Secretion system C-terminal sorting domain-containing protein n=1 Tax=Flavobacterium pallidum TaxID=2172098 RepID=A0A2S1SEF9_9FLAO|nr:T9SS type A sorting domain-containing protein [Flavobacterium pallidum]AWI24779.1 hypothetical protein HYN49_02115 [Flavobacterium pallidum]
MKKNYTPFLLALLFSVLQFSGLMARDKTVSGPVEFFVTGIYLDVNPVGLSPGDNIAYTFHIVNNGPVPMTITLTDPLVGMDNLDMQTLYPGDSRNFNSNYIINQNDIDAGFVENTATIHVSTQDGADFDMSSDDGDPSNGDSNPTITLLTPPQNISSLQLIKTAAVNGNGQAGDLITYYFTVTNTGTTTISNLAINDALTGSILVPVTPSTLLPGQTAFLATAYIITDANVNAGFVINSAAVIGTDPAGNQVTDVSDEGNPENGNDNPTVTMLNQAPAPELSMMMTTYQNGNEIVMTYDITNTGMVTLYNVTLSTAIPQGMVLDNNGVVGTLLPGVVTSLTGHYIVTEQDIANGALDFVSTVDGYDVTGQTLLATQTNIITITVFPSGGIRLKAFVDANGNNIKDDGEAAFSLGQFRYVKNDTEDQQYIYPYLGEALIYGSSMDSYDVYFEIDPQYASLYTLTTASYENITPSSDTTYYFPVTAVSASYDLKVSLLQAGFPPRPGFEYQNLVEYTNNGSQAIASGTVFFNADGLTTVTAVSEPGAIVSASGFTYNFTDLQPFETRYMYVMMQVPPIPEVDLGQLLTNTVSGNISENDAFPYNNSDFSTAMIVGSWDPNDKTEKHGGKILFSGFSADDTLTYTIQFENTGTANAQNVSITDTLDAMLDENTVRMVGASAPYVLERNGNELTWKFTAIDLPPSEENTTIGHGYVTFEVKPEPGFELGDIIPNTASIYFDFNPAIVTNTFQTEFVSQLGVNDVSETDFRVYPNPAKDKVSVSMTGSKMIKSLELMDISGKSLLSENINANRAEMNLSGMSAGIYLLKLKSENGVETLKLIKQ